MVVIGAGLSGLAAADSLKTHDPSLQVIVLEASDRVGGRTVSGTIGDKSVDLGGQWILPEHKPLLQVRKLCTPARTLSISGLKSRVLKLPFMTYK